MIDDLAHAAKRLLNSLEKGEFNDTIARATAIEQLRHELKIFDEEEAMIACLEMRWEEEQAQTILNDLYEREIERAMQ